MTVVLQFISQDHLPLARRRENTHPAAAPATASHRSDGQNAGVAGV